MTKYYKGKKFLYRTIGKTNQLEMLGHDGKWLATSRHTNRPLEMSGLKRTTNSSWLFAVVAVTASLLLLALSLGAEHVIK